MYIDVVYNYVCYDQLNIDSRKQLAHHKLRGVLFILLQLSTNQKLRVKHMNRVEVLDRVGSLLLLPNTELATTKQVAEFYGVDREAIKSLIKRNCEELESNGMIHMKFLEIRETINSGSNVVNVNTLDLKD